MPISGTDIDTDQLIPARFTKVVTFDDAQRQELVEGIRTTTAHMKANQHAIEETAESLPYVESAD